MYRKCTTKIVVNCALSGFNTSLWIQKTFGLRSTTSNLSWMVSNGDCECPLPMPTCRFTIFSDLYNILKMVSYVNVQVMKK